MCIVIYQFILKDVMELSNEANAKRKGGKLYPAFG